MSIAQTEAAKKLEACGSEANSHKVISLLLEGALERIEQSKTAIQNSNIDEAQVLVEKLTAIVKGLNNSLNFENGGVIALNLEKVYAYILDRLEALPIDEAIEALTEMAQLLGEIKSGWDAIEPKNGASIAQAS